MSKVLTGICVHCGRPESLHYGFPIMQTEYRLTLGNGDNCLPDPNKIFDHFEDSGLVRLHENSEELFEAIQKVLSSPASGPQFTPNGVKYFDQMILMEHYEELISIIQKIKTP